MNLVLLNYIPTFVLDANKVEKVNGCPVAEMLHFTGEQMAGFELDVAISDHPQAVVAEFDQGKL
ncbi:MAG: hypothetical protein MK319_08360 [Pseudomonadales bacterium]|nr:hypothetical protein [Pseudomonadales bacterium]